MDLSSLAKLAKIASTQTPDQRAVEKAFGEQAYTMCTNKAGPLMGDQYRLGFEMVDSNEDFTKCLGLWVYRIFKELLMVPCIFVNGRVVGTDLLYRAGPKKFVPHTPEYCQYLLDLTTQDEGRPQTRADTGKLQPLFHAERLLRTPEAFGKLSSSHDFRIPEEFREQVKAAAQDMERQVKVAGVLRDFIQDSGDGLEVIDRLTDMMSKSAMFARAIALHFPPEKWMPDTVAVKRAAVVEDPVLLQLFRGAPDPATLSKAFNREKVAADLYSQGYALDKPDTCPVPEHNTIVYDGGPPELRSPGTPGVMKLMLAGGDTIRVAMGLEMDGYDFISSKDDTCCDSPGSLTSSISTVDRHPRLRVVALDKPNNIEDGVIWVGREPLWTEPQDSGQLDQQGTALGEAPADELYVFVHPESGRMTQPLYLLDKRKVGSVTHLSIATYPGGTGSMVILNPDARDAKMRNVINDSWRAIRVPYRTRSGNSVSPCCGSSTDTFSDKRAPEWFCPVMSPATAQDIRASVTLNVPNTKLAALRYDPQAGKPFYSITINKQASFLMTPEQMHVKLAGTLMIEPEQAALMMQQAKQAGKAEFWLEFPEKYASAMLRLLDREQFEPTMNPIFQVRQQDDQRATLRTARTPIYTPNARIGDKADSIRGANNDPDTSMDNSKSMPTRILMSASPEQLAQYAEMHQLPHVIDHGIFTSMAKTYDSQMFIDQYLVKIEDGVDAEGRCIFLFYWKPQDWTKMYGQDDLSEIEDKLLNAFKSSGDILLDLLKKSRNSASSPVMS